MGKAPLFVRPPTDAERQVLEDGLRSPDAFVLRRAQIILASAQGEPVGVIAPRVGFSGQAVRDVIRAFNARGLAVLQQGSRQHPDWLLGFADEVWWSRLAQPPLSTWQDGAHLLRLVEQTLAPDDPDPKALACYGLLVRCWDAASRRSEDLWLRFVEGRPVSAVTIDFLRWCAERAQEHGKRAVLLIWDNASWHDSQRVRTWVRQHNRQVKQSGHGVQLVVCYLPITSPWLNPSEPKWLAGKKRVAEPARLLSAQELEDRVCAAVGCLREPHLIQPHCNVQKSKQAA